MNQQIYLDHNATSPVDPAVLDVMMPFFSEHFGNPASIEHEHGHVAHDAVERARSEVAQAIGADSRDVLFTANCTEANNLAILGAASGSPTKRHIMASAIEHPSVLEPCLQLQRTGYDFTIIPVDALGMVDPEFIRSGIRADTLLVSVMAANNEVGTLQPIADIAGVCEETDALFHVDMAQLPAYERIALTEVRADLASFSAHKAYGPKGVGALYVRNRRPRIRLAAIIHGGGQERGLRSGTIATPLVVGMGAAFKLAARCCERDQEVLRRQCTLLLQTLQNALSEVRLNGHPTLRLANNLSLSITGVEPLALMRRLRQDLSFSSSSACATDTVKTSHVLLALFGDTPRARHAFRIAPGRFTTDAQLAHAAALLIEGVQSLRGVAM